MFKTDKMVIGDCDDCSVPFRCPYWECGWCYVSLEVENANQINGECICPAKCEYLKEIMEGKNV